MAPRASSHALDPESNEATQISGVVEVSGACLRQPGNPVTRKPASQLSKSAALVETQHSAPRSGPGVGRRCSFARRASVSAQMPETPARDENQASAGAQSAPDCLLCRYGRPCQRVRTRDHGVVPALVGPPAPAALGETELLRGSRREASAGSPGRTCGSASSVPLAGVHAPQTRHTECSSPAPALLECDARARSRT